MAERQAALYLKRQAQLAGDDAGSADKGSSFRYKNYIRRRILSIIKTERNNMDIMTKYPKIKYVKDG